MVLTTQRNGFSFTGSACKELNNEERNFTNIFLRVKFFQDFTSRRSYLDRNWKEEEEPTVQSTISTMIEKLLEWDGMLSFYNSQERKAFQN